MKYICLSQGVKESYLHYNIGIYNKHLIVW